MAALSESQLSKFTNKELVSHCLKIQNLNTTLKNTLDELQSKVEILSNAVNVLKENAEKSNTNTETNGNPELVERILNLEKDNYSTQQYSRRDSVEIFGFPENIADADLEQKAIELFEEVGVITSPDQIQACHRLYDKKRTIVKFCNRKTADQILAARGQLKGFDSTKINLPGKIKLYINYSLCPYYRMIHGKLKSLYNDKHIFSFWVSNGSVRYRVNEFGNYVTVRHLNELTEVFGKV